MEQTVRERAQAMLDDSCKGIYADPDESGHLAQKLIDAVDVLEQINDICYGKVKHVNHHARILAIVDEIQRFHDGGVSE
jgi:hypothetical protein